MKLRVFVGSTMKDLANERDAVCRRLREFGMQPVNAEGWLPDGGDAWTRIAAELETSDLFVLLLGETYGWIPPSGPGSETGLAVTEIEYLAARQQGIPVLPFMKRLAYDPTPPNPAKQARDAFREKVAAWESGQVVAQFDLAHDLADSVSRALIEVLTREYQKARVSARVNSKPPYAVAASTAALPPLAPGLVSDVRDGSAVLLAGAGMSISAGMPTAMAFAEYLREAIREVDPGYAAGISSFAATATDLEALASRDTLVSKVRDMLDPPQGATATHAHRVAVQAFRLILTTNWDGLFEQALHAAGDERKIASEADAEAPAAGCLLKLHGSLERPSSLLFTEADVSRMDARRGLLWRQAQALVTERPVVVVGTSLRDPSVIKMFEAARPHGRGYFVAPVIDAATRARLRRWRLECVEASADDFFEALRIVLPIAPPG